MAICGTCSNETPRVRCRWTEKGIELPDECPNCAPQSFEKFTDPSDKKIWMGFEAHPNEYVKAEDGGYDRKPEYRAEQEERLGQPTEEEREAEARAIRKKRAERRTMPMTPSEQIAAMAKAAQYAAMLEEGTDIVH